MTPSHTERVLTQLDHARLHTLSRRQPSFDGLLSELLNDAALVPSREVASDVVTMYTQVRVRDAGTGAEAQFVICYPHDADARAGFVSVLSPAGMALLGLSVGETARWRNPDGSAAAMQLLEILYQPEANGDYGL